MYQLSLWLQCTIVIDFLHGVLRLNSELDVICSILPFFRSIYIFMFFCSHFSVLTSNLHFFKHSNLHISSSLVCFFFLQLSWIFMLINFTALFFFIGHPLPISIFCPFFFAHWHSWLKIVSQITYLFSVLYESVIHWKEKLIRLHVQTSVQAS